MAPPNYTSLQLDIPVLLPDAPDAADACIGRLVAELRGRDGVSWVHVLAADGDQPAKLCIHYDPDTLSLRRIKEVAEGAGAEITSNFGHVLWQLEGITAARRGRTVTDYLLRQPGVQEASVSAGGAVRIEFDRTLTSASALQRALDEPVNKRKMLRKDGHYLGVLGLTILPCCQLVRVRCHHVAKANDFECVYNRW